MYNPVTVRKLNSRAKGIAFDLAWPGNHALLVSIIILSFSELARSQEQDGKPCRHIREYSSSI